MELTILQEETSLNYFKQRAGEYKGSQVGVEQARGVDCGRQGSWGVQSTAEVAAEGHGNQVTRSHRSQSWIWFFSLHSPQNKIQMHSVALSVLQSGSPLVLHSSPKSLWGH